VRERPDEELLLEHLAGRSDAFETLVTRYANDLFGFFQRFVGNAAAADDLVQETFLQVHLAARSFDPARAFKPWLYTIAANKGRDFMRARGRRPTHSLDIVDEQRGTPSPAALIESPEATAPIRMDVDEQTERVRALIVEMPEHLRLILVLGHYQKLPYAEIADILGIPVGTVKSRLHSAVQHFTRLWTTQTENSTSEK